ncbi:AzlD domain-containing protein [Zoogloea sp.]|uniref:AzlD domain-containing protein n=1 Tax=Zoogloea sp. TaxID=49181 RepID=UPI0035B47910
MSEDWMLWGLFILLGLVTTLPRASFIVLGERAALPETLHRALRYAPAAALAAIVAPDIFVSGGELTVFSPRLAAAVAAVLAALLSRNPWLPFIAGMGVLWGIGPLIPT